MRCPSCGQQLRLTVSEKNFGREVEVTCSNCSAKFRTTISYPAKTHEEFLRQVGERVMDKMDADDIRRLTPLVEEFGEVLNDAVTTSSPLAEVVEKMRRAGYDPFVVLECSIGFQRREGTEVPQPDVHEPTPLVQNGEVVPGAFTAEDDKWMGKLKINLSDD
jgi:hypothetical protein